MVRPKDNKIRPDHYESTMASKLKIMEGEIKANNRGQITDVKNQEDKKNQNIE